MSEHLQGRRQGRQAALLWSLGCAGLSGWLACSSPAPSTAAPPAPATEVQPAPATEVQPAPAPAAPAADRPAEASPAPGCDPKQPAACWKAAQEAEKAAKTFEDWDRVYSLKEQACDAGATPQSCYDAAATHWEKDNRAQAEKYFLKGCDQDFGLACAGLGDLYASEPRSDQAAAAGPPEAKGPDYAKAVKYLEKACKLKAAGGCSGLGILVADGQGAKKDLARAVSLWHQACQYGSDVDCLTVGTFLAEGRAGVKKDVARARQAFDTACKRKYEDACKAAAKLAGK